MSSFSSVWLRAVLVGVLMAEHAAAAEACALGAGEGPRERAKAEYGSGLTAFGEKRYREAIDHLTCANELVPSAELAYNIAVTTRWTTRPRRCAGTESTGGKGALTPIRRR